jgi:hypothetical protein
MKTCNNCPFFEECWEHYSNFCYRDKEIIANGETKEIKPLETKDMTK